MHSYVTDRFLRAFTSENLARVSLRFTLNKPGPSPCARNLLRGAARVRVKIMGQLIDKKPRQAGRFAPSRLLGLRALALPLSACICGLVLPAITCLDHPPTLLLGLPPPLLLTLPAPLYPGCRTSCLCLCTLLGGRWRSMTQTVQCSR